VVESFANLLSQLVEHGSTNTYAVVFHFCQIETIHFLVLRYLNTGALTIDEFSEQWLFDGEVECSSVSGRVCGTVSIMQGSRLPRWN